MMSRSSSANVAIMVKKNLPSPVGEVELPDDRRRHPETRRSGSSPSRARRARS
jgi:hypothetical protein